MKRPVRKPSRRPTEASSPVGLLLKAAVSSRVATDLALDEDEPRALRRALLTLIWLVQDDADDATANFVNQLLSDFAPLAKHFQNRRQFLLRGQYVLRAPISPTRIGVLLNEAFARELLEETVKELLLQPQLLKGSVPVHDPEAPAPP